LSYLEGSSGSGILVGSSSRRLSIRIGASVSLLLGFVAVVSPGPASAASACASSIVPNATTTISPDGTTVDDLEGSGGADQLYGDSLDNNLLGRLGKDEIWGREGADRIEAQDEIAEVGGGGPGTDSCVLDANDKFNSCNP
jgi:Ca2+-binding RTX toxin-like protein